VEVISIVDAERSAVRSIAWLGASGGMLENADPGRKTRNEDDKDGVSKSDPPRIGSPAQICIGAQEKQWGNNDAEWPPKYAVDGTGRRRGYKYLENRRHTQQTKKLNGSDQYGPGYDGKQNH
jgi:hypothetical protein